MPVPPLRNQAYTFFVTLTSQADPNIFQVNPTLAVGDVQVSIDGGALNNLITLPVVTPAGSRQVQVDLAAAEMNGDVITVVFSDVAGAEWQDLYIEIFTDSFEIGDLARVLGFNQENFVLDNTIYNANRMLTSCRVRLFANAALALAATDGAAPGADGEFAAYAITATEEPAIAGVAQIYRSVRTL